MKGAAQGRIRCSGNLREVEEPAARLSPVSPRPPTSETAAMKTYAAVSLLCLLSLASSALGLKCYQCTGESCVDPYTPDGQHPVECTADLAKNAAKVYNRFSSALGSIGINAPSIGEPKMVCAKVTVKDTQAEVVSRSCAATSDSLDFCENMKNLIGDKLQHCSICEGDLCNSAPATYASLGLMTAVAVVLSYLH